MFQTFHLNRLRVFCGAHAKQTVLFECGEIFAPHSYIKNMKKKNFMEDGNSSQLKAGYLCREM